MKKLFLGFILFSLITGFISAYPSVVSARFMTETGSKTVSAKNNSATKSKPSSPALQLLHIRAGYGYVNYHYIPCKNYTGCISKVYDSYDITKPISGMYVIVGIPGNSIVGKTDANGYVYLFAPIGAKVWIGPLQYSPNLPSSVYNSFSTFNYLSSDNSIHYWSCGVRNPCSIIFYK